MEVGKKDVPAYGRSILSVTSQPAYDVFSQLTDPGSGVENDEHFAETNFNARCVSTILERGGSRTRETTVDTPESEEHGIFHLQSPRREHARGKGMRTVQFDETVRTVSMGKPLESRVGKLPTQSSNDVEESLSPIAPQRAPRVARLLDEAESW
jgi:hypothetical protein